MKQYFISVLFQTFAHPEIKLKQNTETVSASLAYFSTRPS